MGRVVDVEMGGCHFFYYFTVQFSRMFNRKFNVRNSLIVFLDIFEIKVLHFY